ncbi:MAG: xanthine dehydrogenase family protein subunit M [Desulfurococcaceae archaeon]
MSWNINLANTRIIPCEFEYYEPDSVDEAVRLLDKLGPEAKVIAGGTDLLVQVKMGVVKPKYIVNIKRIKEMYGVIDKGDHLFIGSLTTLRELESSELVKNRFQALHEAVSSMGSWQIRCLASIGGNLCNASPAADTAPPLLVYNAELIIYGLNGFKTVSINRFFKGPKKTILNYNEILYGIKIPYENRRHSSVFIKIARTSMDLAKVNIAVKLVIGENNIIEDVAIALGSVAPTPVRAFTVENYLKNKVFSEELIREGCKLVVRDINPITDIRSTSEYREHLSKILVYDSLIKAYNRLLKVM